MQTGAGPLCLGFPNLDPYLVRSPYFGALVGRYANRIGSGRFTHVLHRNEAGRTTLNGGSGGFATQVWDIVDHSDRHMNPIGDSMPYPRPHLRGLSHHLTPVFARLNNHRLPAKHPICSA